MPNGQCYTDPVAKLEISDVLQISQGKQTLDNVSIVYTEPTKGKGSEIFASSRAIRSEAEVNELYKTVSIDPVSTVANHRNLISKLKNKLGKMHV